MLQKFFRLTLAASIGALLVFPGTSSAGVASNLTLAATTSTSITAGQTVTFAVSFNCGSPWTTGTAQLFNGSISDPIGSAVTLNPAQAVTGNTVYTQSITATFAQSGTYSINVKVANITNNGSGPLGCDLNAITSGSPISVTVAAAPTTTTPATTTTTPATTTTVAATTTLATTTTTVAPTTTTTTPVVTTKKLPSTGAQPNAVVLALSAFAVGFAALAVRKRRI